MDMNMITKRINNSEEYYIELLLEKKKKIRIVAREKIFISVSDMFIYASYMFIRVVF